MLSPYECRRKLKVQGVPPYLAEDLDEMYLAMLSANPSTAPPSVAPPTDPLACPVRRRGVPRQTARSGILPPWQ